MQANQTFPVRLVRKRPAVAHVEPVAFGVPFARGILRSPEQIEVRDDTGRLLPRQAETLALWPDGSVRWALLDLVLTAPASDSSEQLLRVGVRDTAPDPPPRGDGVVLQENPSRYAIDTGPARFELARDQLAPFTIARVADPPSPSFRSRVRFTTANGAESSPRLAGLRVAARGPLRLTLAGEGELGGEAPCRFAARVSFFHATPLVRLDLTVHNPRRARHRGGVWDLGDPGSILFRALSVEIEPVAPLDYRIAWRLSDGAVELGGESGRVEIHQASSGGEQWASRNHVDRSGAVPLPFRGCRVTRGEKSERVDRPEPVVAWSVAGARAVVAVPRFWQEFPKCVEAGPGGLRVGLFPAQSAPFELQGGEQKTHTVWIHLASAENGGDATAGLLWVHDPLIACLGPEHVAASDALPHVVPEERDPHRDYVRHARRAIEGPHSLFAKREIIDEYGWRNFGDAYADHEDEHFAGAHPVISHYNNQYDLVYGLLVHFARSADPRWLELAADLARHVIDIDIYRARADRPAYSGGLFWHTDHYQDAGRATHRTYSADSPAAGAGRAYGGGPSNEHNYTSGLLHYHYLTGDPAARAAVLELAEWVLRMDDGALGLLGAIDPGPTGLASRTRDPDYHGPGRGAANSIVAMIDAHRLTGERRFLTKAEELIARCIHPRDDPSDHELLDAERRWSYTVFLQALGEYLDLKLELAECDRAFAYARASLCRYAEWMAEHEAPMRGRLASVEYPTDTWPAQDVRKSCVFDYAARYGPDELRERATERAELFFRASIDAALSPERPPSTRVLAIMLANGVQRAAFRLYGPRVVASVEAELDFGAPRRFLSQRARVRRRLRTTAGVASVVRALLRPSVLRRLVSGELW